MDAEDFLDGRDDVLHIACLDSLREVLYGIRILFHPCRDDAGELGPRRREGQTRPLHSHAVTRRPRTKFLQPVQDEVEAESELPIEAVLGGESVLLDLNQMRKLAGGDLLEDRC